MAATSNVAIPHWGIALFLVSILHAAAGQALSPIDSQMEFSWNLYEAVSKQVKGNFLFSPMSLSISLSMLAAGAKGKTQDELLNVLRLIHPGDLERMHAFYRGIPTVLLNNSISFTVANKLFLKDDFQVLPAYQSLLTKDYRSEVGAINTESGASTINNWVSSVTHKMINDLIPPNGIQDDTRLVLANAIYFKGQWNSKFDKSDTKIGTFHPSNADAVDVPFMNQVETFDYLTDEELQLTALELPYAGGHFSMVIILPFEGVSLSSIEKKLDGNKLQKIFEDLRSHTVNVSIPKFKLEGSIPAKEILQSMGVSDVFSDHSDLSNIAPQPLYVSSVEHKSLLDVSEEGTEAAASTGVVVGLRSLPRPVSFTANRHFAFVIIEKTEFGKQLAFFGKVENPVLQMKALRSISDSGVCTYCSFVLIAFCVTIAGHL